MDSSSIAQQHMYMVPFGTSSTCEAFWLDRSAGCDLGGKDARPKLDRSYLLCGYLPSSLTLGLSMPIPLWDNPPDLDPSLFCEPEIAIRPGRDTHRVAVAGGDRVLGDGPTRGDLPDLVPT